ncbi:MAG: DUF397 domain-containing protein [Streptomycetaceae bacterium]|nr:DUF397 domain-containing protein [Streptomycetaceae bacterium]
MTTHRRPSPEDLAAADYRKSSYSGGGGNECVEMAEVGTWIAVRDSKDPHGPALAFNAGAWTAFVSDVQRVGH